MFHTSTISLTKIMSHTFGLLISGVFQTTTEADLTAIVDPLSAGMLSARCWQNEIRRRQKSFSHSYISFLSQSSLRPLCSFAGVSTPRRNADERKAVLSNACNARCQLCQMESTRTDDVSPWCGEPWLGRRPEEFEWSNIPIVELKHQFWVRF